MKNIKLQYIVLTLITIVSTGIIMFVSFNPRDNNLSSQVQSFQDTQNNIQEAIQPANANISQSTLQTEIPTKTLSELNNLDVPISNPIISDLTFLSDYENYTLLDKTKVFILTKEQLTENSDRISNILVEANPNNYIPPELKCITKKCSIILTKENELLFPKKNIEYLTSFASQGEVYWFFYELELDGHIVGYYSKPRFQESKLLPITLRITKIKELGENSGKFIFTIIEEDSAGRILDIKEKEFDLPSEIKNNGT
jgi:hypothetical protein